MPVVYHNLLPAQAVLPSSGGPTLGSISGTNFPISALQFDANNDENSYFVFRPQTNMSNFTVDVDWYANSATSGVVTWGCNFAAITPDTDTGSIEAKSFGGTTTFNDTHLGTTPKRLHRATSSISLLDSGVMGDWMCMRFFRNGSNAADTMTGDANVVLVTVSYSG